MRLLVLGGTRFVGRGIVDAALDAGHEVTLFHRGRTGPDAFPELEHLQGDRDGGLESLAGGDWDACVDVSGYVPRVVRQSAELLREAVGHYVFVSTISVYADLAIPRGEDGPLATLDDETEEVGEASYGALKALCERVVAEGTAIGARSCGRASSLGRTTTRGDSRGGCTARRAAACCPSRRVSPAASR